MSRYYIEKAEKRHTKNIALRKYEPHEVNKISFHIALKSPSFIVAVDLF